jgi:deoxyadenosine/deoxycytidine kinase
MPFLPKTLVVAIEGQIGAGKTTLLNQFRNSATLSQRGYTWEIVPECLDAFCTYGKHNPLALAYHQPTTNAGFSQLHITREINKQFATTTNRTADSTPVQRKQPHVILCDRSLFSPLVFTAVAYRLGSIGTFVRDFLDDETHRQAQKTGGGRAQLDGVFFVETDNDTCLKRIDDRGRPYEATVTPTYLQLIREEYKQLLGWLRKEKKTLIHSERNSSPEQLHDFISELIAERCKIGPCEENDRPISITTKMGKATNKRAATETFQSDTDFENFKQKCSWCGRFTELAKNKKFCAQCARNCFRECQRCHNPYPNECFFTLDAVRCDTCHRKLLAERAAKARRNQQSEGSDQTVMATAQRPETPPQSATKSSTPKKKKQRQPTLTNVWKTAEDDKKPTAPQKRKTPSPKKASGGHRIILEVDAAGAISRCLIHEKRPIGRPPAETSAPTAAKRPRKPSPAVEEEEEGEAITDDDDVLFAESSGGENAEDAESSSANETSESD